MIKIIVLSLASSLVFSAPTPKAPAKQATSASIREYIEENDSLTLLTNPTKWAKGPQTVILFDYTVPKAKTAAGTIKITGKHYATDTPMANKKKQTPKENLADLKISMKAGERIILCIDPAAKVGGNTVFSYSVGTGRGARVKANVAFTEK